MYTLASDIKDLAPNETALKLDDGSTVVVSVDAKVSPNNTEITFTGKARCLDTGAKVSFTHSESASRVLSLGRDTIAKDMILAMLGEPNPLPKIPWSAAMRDQINVRNVISLKKATVSKPINPGKALGLTR